MNSFLEAFFKIDVDGSEEITTDELKEYMKVNNYKDTLVEVIN